MVKTSAQTKRNLMSEFKGMVMDRDVGRKISANQFSKENKRISKKNGKDTGCLLRQSVQGYSGALWDCQI